MKIFIFNNAFTLFISTEPQLSTSLPNGLPPTQKESDLSETGLQNQPETPAGRGCVQIGLGLKVEQEEPEEHSEIQVVVCPSDEIVKREQDQQELEIPVEMQPVSSDSSEAENDSNGSDEEWARNRGAKTKIKRPKPAGKSSARRVNGLLVCPTCGKGFQYIRPLMKHITKHKKTNAPMTEFLHDLQSAYKKTFVCGSCGKKFASAGCLKMHSKIHTGERDFRCQDCGKTFIQKGHLTVHKRTHSGERPYYCEFCGRGFSQKQNLSSHKRRIHAVGKWNNFIRDDTSLQRRLKTEEESPPQ